MKPYIIPIFIPHQGCPQQCVFCNQRTITGQQTPTLRAETVSSAIQSGLQRKRRAARTETQVAFYGGTFTGLTPMLQEELLAAAACFVERGEIDTIRISTRPDYVGDEAITLLRRFAVGIVELGIQSMDDAVLTAAQRGHSSTDSFRALRLLKATGFRVGAQIMIGLPGDNRERLLPGIRALLDCGPEFIRIYPTLVLKGTALAALYGSGRYRPLAMEEAIELCREVYVLCRESGVSVIRLGLQADAGLEQSIVAGPYHPAFGELVMARVLQHDILRELSLLAGSDEVDLSVPPSAVSLLTGFKRKVLNDLCRESRIRSFRIATDGTLGSGEFRVTPSH